MQSIAASMEPRPFRHGNGPRAKTTDHTSAVNGHTMPRQAYALVIVHENFRMLLWQVAHLTQLTQKFPLADAHTASILQQFAARLDAVHEGLEAVVTPAMQTTIEAEVARFEADMQRDNKRMRRQPRRTAQAGL